MLSLINTLKEFIQLCFLLSLSNSSLQQKIPEFVWQKQTFSLVFGHKRVFQSHKLLDWSLRCKPCTWTRKSIKVTCKPNVHIGGDLVNICQNMDSCSKGIFQTILENQQCPYERRSNQQGFCSVFPFSFLKKYKKVLYLLALILKQQILFFILSSLYYRFYTYYLFLTEDCMKRQFAFSFLKTQTADRTHLEFFCSLAINILLLKHQ